MEDTKEKQPKYKTSYTHCFTELAQILEYCNSQDIDDDYLIDGLKNSINADLRIEKPPDTGGHGMMG